MSETALLQQVRLACSRDNTRLFRNNVAMAWVGTVHSRSPEYLTLRNYRPLHAGLCPGSSDLVGWTVRNGVAVFTAIETKAPRGRLSEEQRNFLTAVRNAGGISGEVRSVEEAVALLG